MENKKRLIIVDSNALLHRAFHALPPLKNKSGQPTGAAYGFLLTLFKAIDDLKVAYIVACFDTKGPTFRHEKFKDYKAHRPKTPEDIISQISITKGILEVLGIPVFAKEGVEADDLIATICNLVVKQDKDLDIYILSGDLDNLQLVKENIKVYTLGKGIKDTVVYDRDKIKERFGISPSQIIDFKALVGDSSDNVPGVPGIGKKTAAEIIQEYGTIENLYSELSTNTAVLKPRIKESLISNKNSAFLAKELVEMKKDIPLQFSLETSKFGRFDLKKAEEKLKELDFNSLISRLPSFQLD